MKFKHFIIKNDDDKKSFRLLAQIIVIVLFFFIIGTITFFQEDITLPTGKVTHDARGGYVTRLDLSQEAYTYWEGYYGNLSANVSQYYCGMPRNNDPITLIVTGTTVVSEKLLGLNYCNNTEIYFTISDAHLNNTIYPILPGRNYLNGMTAATGAQLDSYYDFDMSQSTSIRTSAVSGTNTFPDSINSVFNVGDNDLIIPTQTMNSVSGHYKLGILKDSYGNVIFVTDIKEGRLSFLGDLSDFEFILPVSPFRTLKYYFFQDSTDNCGFPAGLGPYEIVSTNPYIIDLKDQVDVSLIVSVLNPVNVSFAVTNTPIVPICAYTPVDEGKNILDKFIYIEASNQTINNMNSTEIRVYYDSEDTFYKNIYENNLRLYRWNYTFYTWDLLEMSGVDTNNKYVWGITDDFGLFVVIESNITTVNENPEIIPSSGGGGGGSSGGASILEYNTTIICSENWICSQWSECAENGVQQRTCIDSNNCNTTFLKPETAQFCFYNPRNKNPILERPDLIAVNRSELFSLKITNPDFYKTINLNNITYNSVYVDAIWRINKYNYFFLWSFLIVMFSICLMIGYILIKKPKLEVGYEKLYEEKLPEWNVLRKFLVILILFLLLSSVLFLYEIKFKQNNFVNLDVNFIDDGLFTKPVSMVINYKFINDKNNSVSSNSENVFVKNGTIDSFKLVTPLFLNKNSYNLSVVGTYNVLQWSDEQQIVVNNIEISFIWYLIYFFVLISFFMIVLIENYFRIKQKKLRMKKQSESKKKEKARKSLKPSTSQNDKNLKENQELN